MAKKMFHTFEVVMTNCYGTEKRRIIKTAVSKSAAALTANIKERIEGKSDRYWSRLVYQLDADNRRVFT